MKIFIKILYKVMSVFRRKDKPKKKEDDIPKKKEDDIPKDNYPMF